MMENITKYQAKKWISNAGFASLMIVFARIENDKNITAFLVDYDPSNGIKLEKKRIN